MAAVLPAARAQPSSPEPPAQPTASVEEKWSFFVNETVSPLTLAAATFDATTSQVTRSFPLYGRHWWRHDAFGKRFGATLGDNVSQNFFADFLMASALHEDTRYVRKGPSHKFWPRFAYALTRAVVARTDAGAATFNWANVVGCAMSAALSNAYYPPGSRNAGVAVTNWGTNIAGAGLANLAPEFGPGVKNWMKRHLLFRR